MYVCSYVSPRQSFKDRMRSHEEGHAGKKQSLPPHTSQNKGQLVGINRN